MRRYPNSRMGWHEFYVAKANRTDSKFTVQLALWHYMLFLAFGEKPNKGLK